MSFPRLLLNDSITYRFRTNDLQFMGGRIQRLARSANSIHGLLCYFVGNLLTHDLESGDGAEQVPGLSYFSLFGVTTDCTIPTLKKTARRSIW